MLSPVNGDSAAWTIDRLARLAAAALAAGAPTQPNGRIREVPDVRTIRWYTSIGLLDRPGAMRGRTALYGRSHLAQLVAIKRLQATGLTVAAVQERLLGAEEAAIEEIAMLPADVDALVAQVEAEAAAEADAVAAGPVASEPKARGAAPGAPGARTRFWAAAGSPAEDVAANAVAMPSPPETAGPASITEPASVTGPTSTTGPASTAGPSSTTEAVPTVHGLRLAADVTLLLPPGRVPDAAARAAIAEAARPLLDLLDRLGLSGS